MCTLEYTSEQESIVVSETIFEITRGKLTPICETSIPLQSQLKCHSYDERCKKLVLGCCDGSLVIYTQDGKVTHYTKVVFVSYFVFNYTALMQNYGHSLQFDCLNGNGKHSR